MPIFNNILAGAAGQAAGGADAGYKIERSLRFNDDDSAYLSKTFSSQGNCRTYTISLWTKRGDLGIKSNLFNAAGTAGSSPADNERTEFRFNIQDELHFAVNSHDPTKTLGASGSTLGWKSLETVAVFRDPSAWYHIVVSVDTTQATASDRVTIWVNGVEQAVTGTYPTLDEVTPYGRAHYHTIGAYANGINDFHDGLIADPYFIDGQALAASDFGEYDNNGVWQPKEVSGVTYGTNGFHLDFSDNSTSAALGTDSSSNSNDWTVNNLVAEQSTTFPGVAFDGAGDSLSIADNADFDFGTGDFTVELFAYNNSESATNPVLIGASGGWYLQFKTDGTIAEFNTGSTSVQATGLSLEGGWHHIAVARSGSSLKMFVDGVLKTTTTNSDSTDLADTLYIGNFGGGSLHFLGAISNVRVVKGTALYTSSFTLPTTPLSNTTNTVLLCCQSSSSATAAAVSPGTITPNGNVYAGTFSDETSADDSLDSPTNYDDGTNVGGNYATLNPLDSSSSYTLSNGNLDYTHSTSGHQMTSSTIAVNSGKWYVEVTPTALGSTYMQIGITPTGTSNTTYTGNDGYGYLHNGSKQGLTVSSSYGNSYAENDVIGIAFDADNGDLYFYKNGAVQNSGTAAFTGIDTSKNWRFSVSHLASGTGFVNFGQRPFAYTPPTGYKALCTQNLDDPLIENGSDYFDVALDTGANILSSTKALCGNGADFLWIKDRDNNTTNHHLIDILRDSQLDGTPFLASNSTSNETTLGTYSAPSGASVGWAWDAGTSTDTNNTDGTITSQVRANASAGFSIVTYTSPNNTAAQSFGHGLNAKPDFILVKNRDSLFNWDIYHSSLGYNAALRFTSDGTRQNAFSAEPTSAVVNTATGYTHNSTDDYVAYCWTAVEGYSAFGSYTGNGTATGDGPFVYTGFRPKCILLKESSVSGNNWSIYDTSRDEYNVAGKQLKPSTDGNEVTNNFADFLSNGFKIRVGTSGLNSDTQTYVWAAFAEHPFRTARAR